MLALLKYADARLGEPSTWASIAMLLGMAHVSVDPGVLHQITLWASIASACFGGLLSEIGSKPGAEVAGDMLATFVAGVKAIPTDVAKPDAPASALAPTRALALFLVVGLALSLTACGAGLPAPGTAATDTGATGAAGPGAAQPATPAVLLGSLQKLVAADLANSIQVANAATPPDTEWPPCAVFLQGNLTTLQAQLGGFNNAVINGNAGLATALETSHVGLNFAQAGISPALRIQFETACGPWTLNYVGSLNWLLARLGVAALPTPKL